MCILSAQPITLVSLSISRLFRPSPNPNLLLFFSFLVAGSSSRGMPAHRYAAQRRSALTISLDFVSFGRAFSPSPNPTPNRFPFLCIAGAASCGVPTHRHVVDRSPQRRGALTVSLVSLSRVNPNLK